MNHEEVIEECLEFINIEVTKCLKLKDRKHQNKLFSSITTTLPIKPIKMTLTTAVFLFKSQQETFVIKRVIVKAETPSQEEEISMKLKHHNILSTFDSRTTYYDTGAGGRLKILWLFSEYLKERISQSKVDRDESVIRAILTDSLTAVAFMHSMNIVHLDLKLANIMGQNIKSTVVYKLIDFGYARDLGKEEHGTTEEVYIHKKAFGTFPYKSPEIVKNNIHGKASDIWCIGAIAWFLSLGKTPFYTRSGDKNTEAHRKFLSSKKDLLFVKDTSKELRNFIELAMKKNRKKRPTAQNLLKHPFITNSKLGSPESSEFEEDGYYSDFSTDDEL